MPTPLVECIPNFSEGRRMEVVDAIARAVSATPGVLLLDRTSDEDHNRSVLTFVGDPQSIEDAAFRRHRQSRRVDRYEPAVTASTRALAPLMLYPSYPSPA